MERLTERTGEGQAIPRMELRNNGHQKCMERLAEYEDLEEQGKLLKLPCAVGDTLYCDGKYFASHCEGKIHSFKVSDIVTEVRSYFRGEVDYCFDFEDFGKTVFLTREEAETALKELEE